MVDHQTANSLKMPDQLLDGLGDLPDFLVALLDQMLDVDDGAHLLLVEGHAVSFRRRREEVQAPAGAAFLLRPAGERVASTACRCYVVASMAWRR